MEHIINSKQAENFYSFHKPREFSLDMFCMFWEKTNKPTKKVNTPLPLPQKEKGIKKKKERKQTNRNKQPDCALLFLPFWNVPCSKHSYPFKLPSRFKTNKTKENRTQQWQLQGLFESPLLP